MDDIVAKEATAIAKREAALARRKAMAEWRKGRGRRNTRQLAEDDLDFFGCVAGDATALEATPSPQAPTLPSRVCVRSNPMTPRQREQRRRSQVLDKFRAAAKKVITMSDVRTPAPCIARHLRCDVHTAHSW